MKKAALILIICSFLFTSCGKENSNTQNGGNVSPTMTATPKATATATPQQLLGTVSDYFPFTKDIHMRYIGSGNEYASFDLNVEFLNSSRIQLKKVNGGTESVLVYQVKNGEMKNVYTQNEIYYRYNFLNKTNSNDIVLKDPIAVGTSWTLSDGSTRSITAVDKAIVTSSGNYPSIEVTTTANDSTTKDYYSKGVGLVKTVFTPANGGETISSELGKVETGIPCKQTIRFYFPQFAKNKLVYIDRNVESFTNQDIKYKFQKELKTIPATGGLAKALTKNTTVLSVEPDAKNGIVTVNLSDQFLKEMNAGADFESMLLQSITNTFGDYYGMQKVIITIAGKPYESGHILMGPGEYFKVDKSNVVKF